MDILCIPCIISISDIKLYLDVETKYFDSLTPFGDNQAYVDKLQQDIRDLRKEYATKPKPSPDIRSQRKNVPEHRDAAELESLVRRSFWDDLSRMKEKIVKKPAPRDPEESEVRDSWYRTSRRFSDSRYVLDSSRYSQVLELNKTKTQSEKKHEEEEQGQNGDKDQIFLLEPQSKRQEGFADQDQVPESLLPVPVPPQQAECRPRHGRRWRGPHQGLELQTKIKRRFAQISQSRRRPLLRPSWLKAPPHLRHYGIQALTHGK